MERVTVQGTAVPAVGLGTWRLTGDEAWRVVSVALELGYRHVDTAQAYGNERQVGRAIADSAVDREDVFLTTKVHGTNARYDDVIRSTEESLDRLDTDYVDLLLLHWPNPLVDLDGTMRALSRLVEDGKARHVGVSNFSVDRLRKARRAASVPIFADQVQFHPYRPQRDLQQYCRVEDVLLVAYSPLAHGGVLRDGTLREIGDRYGKSPAQVAIRWAIQRENVVAIPKASSRRHLAENVDVFDFELSGEEMAAITRPSLARTGVAWMRGRLGV